MKRCFLLLKSAKLGGGVDGCAESSVILTCVIYCSIATIESTLRLSSCDDVVWEIYVVHLLLGY